MEKNHTVITHPKYKYDKINIAYSKNEENKYYTRLWTLFLFVKKSLCIQYMFLNTGAGKVNHVLTDTLLTCLFLFTMYGFRKWQSSAHHLWAGL